jgi:hypothetical protein
MRIDYENPEVVARQNIAPNAGCDIDGVFYDMRNCVHLLKEQADRIEELEAKAMKASNAAFLEKRRADAAEAKLFKSEALFSKAVKMAYDKCPFGYGTEDYYDWWHNRHKLLAELKGETDE